MEVKDSVEDGNTGGYESGMKRRPGLRRGRFMMICSRVWLKARIQLIGETLVYRTCNEMERTS